ncbi:unnamed protein product [Nezara viridula]|uniref:Uncharacterized protein n=1 Tax=Nezara viridula TaxID=85310 RepID=A0A9P0HAZ5_NEZVI|nr:unnamed protein product [Nezara viridula]
MKSRKEEIILCHASKLVTANFLTASYSTVENYLPASDVAVLFALIACPRAGYIGGYAAAPALTYGASYGAAYGYGAGYGYAAPAVTAVAHAPAVSYAAPAVSYAAPAVATVAHAPVAVAHAPVATSYSSSYRTVNKPVAVAAPAISYAAPAVATVAHAPAVSYATPVAAVAHAPAVATIAHAPVNYGLGLRSANDLGSYGYGLGYRSAYSLGYRCTYGLGYGYGGYGLGTTLVHH